MSDDTPKVDWKGRAAFVTAMVGALGFVWNKAEIILDRDTAQQTQKVSYQSVGERLEEVFERLEACEEYLEKEGAILEDHASNLLGAEEYVEELVEQVAETEHQVEAVAVPMAAEPAPPPSPVVAKAPVKPPPSSAIRVKAKYRKARLPDFAALQQQVQEQRPIFLEMEEMEEVMGEAAAEGP